MLTNEDIEKLKSVFATKDDLNRFATKDDLNFVVKDLVQFIGEVHDKLNNKIDKLDKKIDKIDGKFTKQLNGIERNIHVLNKEVQVLTAYKIMTDGHEARLRAIETDLGII